MAEQLGFDLTGDDVGGPPPDLPPDEAARVRIRTDLGATLFVEAGAGAGKTSSLVDRIANLVDDGVDITVSRPSPSPRRRRPSCARGCVAR